MLNRIKDGETWKINVVEIFHDYKTKTSFLISWQIQEEINQISKEDF